MVGRRDVKRDIGQIDLTHADLSGAILSGADLSGADLSGADLTEADLTEADLTEANLSDAYLTGANLSDAYLFNANLSDAHVLGANLSGAHLFGARWPIGPGVPEGWTYENASVGLRPAGTDSGPTKANLPSYRAIPPMGTGRPGGAGMCPERLLARLPDAPGPARGEYQVSPKGAMGW